jgi:hypothetical protein
MPKTEAELDALRTFPETNLTEVPRPTVAAINDEGIKRWKGIPYDMSALVGRVALVRSDGDTLDVVGNSSTDLVSFGRCPVWQWEPRVITITTNTTITDDAHCGALLKCTNVGAITLTFAIAAPGSGISDNFNCTVWRLRSSGAVQIARGSGVTNGNSADHTRVSAGHMTMLLLGGTELGFFGGTEA